MKNSPLILLIFLLFFFLHVKAQTASDSSTETMPNSQGDSVSNFQPSLAVVIGMLSIMFSITFILLLYAKFCHRAASVRHARRLIQDDLIRSDSNASGVDQTVIESLPFFRFSMLKGSRDGLECAVCLSKFEEVEILRLLPKCKHGFHIDCIDQWLEKHSTCPLCRHKVSIEDLSQLPNSNSLRFSWNETEFRQDSNLELYVTREENNRQNGSSKFSIGSSFRKFCESKKEDELPIQESMDCEEHSPLHKFNHKIVVSEVVLKNRWSNVSSSDLMFLNSEMINDISSARFSSLDLRNEQKSREISCLDDQGMSIKEEMDRKRVFENKFRGIKKSSDGDSFESKVMNPNEKRSMSEIIVHPRFTEFKNRDSSLVQNNNQKEERMRRLWLPIARKTVEWFANREKRPPRSQDLEQATNV